jgi:predicted regulator of Ras-like GTPase activity (Roadblock/LC7/MglB family)
MSIPFLDLFKRASARLFPVWTSCSSPRAVALPVAKPSGERLSKTVLPNMTRKVAASRPLRVAPGTVGFDTTSTSPRSRELPAAVALALEPKAERAISLRLSDILDQLPSHYLKPRERFDSNRTILLKASDVEKGMASGRPTVSLAGIYEQAPEIFVNSLSPTDSTVVPLPFDKVLAQFMSLQVRSDQVRDHLGPQVETPFLQVTREDTERFRTSTSAAPPKIPFHLSPNGTGAPASEGVPALSGPPVPTAVLEAPARIPFKVTAPCNDLRPKFIRVPGMEPEPRTGSPTKPSPAKESEAKIALALTAVLEEVPAFQLTGSPSMVPEDVRVEFPLSLIEPQLATGRVVVSPKVLQNAIPEIYRALLRVDPVETPVSLPLWEILKNLPATVLRMRDDQEEIVLKERIETPFSIKADEDAKRFQAGAEPVPKVSGQSPEQAQLEEKIDRQGEDLSAVTSANEEKLDAKSVVARANALPGVAACAITFADGLSLAGNLPPELAAEGLCAVAPSVLQKIDKHMVGVRLGPLRAVTLHAGKSPVTFLMHGNICLAALHAGDELPSDSRNQLATMVEELSRTYSQPEPAHVDH